MNKKRVLKADVWNVECALLVGSRKWGEKEMAKWFGQPRGSVSISETNDGFTLTVGAFHPAIWLPSIKGPRGVACLAHELVHAVYNVLSQRGLPFTPKTQEAFAYLMSHWMEQALGGGRK